MPRSYIPMQRNKSTIKRQRDLVKLKMVLIYVANIVNNYSTNQIKNQRL